MLMKHIRLKKNKVKIVSDSALLTIENYQEI